MVIPSIPGIEDIQAQWLSAIRAMTSSPENAEAFLNDRLVLTTKIARCLTDRLTDSAVLYGVWINDHPHPIYIGQTLEGRRRLWDLPIGESHHLANSFPPEIWTRVVVVYWRRLFDALPENSRQAIESAIVSFGETGPNSIDSAIGLGLEYCLQSEYTPLFNRRKKKRDGSWRLVDWQTSSSVGAQIAPQLNELSEAVRSAWNELTRLPGDATIELSAGRVVFPQKQTAGMNPAAR